MKPEKKPDFEIHTIADVYLGPVNEEQKLLSKSMKISIKVYKNVITNPMGYACCGN